MGITHKEEEKDEEVEMSKTMEAADDWETWKRQHGAVVDGKETIQPTIGLPVKLNESPLPPPEPPPNQKKGIKRTKFSLPGNREEIETKECPSTPTKTAPPGSLLSELARPPSPTNIADFRHTSNWKEKWIEKGLN